MRCSLLPLLPLLALALGCGPAAHSPSPTTPPASSPTPSPPPAQGLAFTPIIEDDPSGLFMSVWATAPEDIWVVGGQADAGALLRGPLGGLAPQALPEGTPLLNWVHGSGPDDVWVVGLQGTALRWNGAAFEDHSIPMEEALWGVYSRGPGEAIAVGGASRYGGTAAKIFAWDGAQWSAVDIPPEVGALTNLFKVTHDGERYWIVGVQGTALKGGPEGFEPVPTGFASDLVTVHGEGSALTVVGGRGTGAAFGPTKAGGLARIVETPAGLSGVHVLGPEAAVIVGERGYAAVLDPSTGSLTTSSYGTDHLLHAVWADPDVGVLAAGGNFYATGAYVGLLLLSPYPAR